MNTCIDCNAIIDNDNIENGAEKDIDGDWFCCDCVYTIYNYNEREYYTADEVVDLRGGGYYSDAEYARDMAGW